MDMAGGGLKNAGEEGSRGMTLPGFRQLRVDGWVDEFNALGLSHTLEKQYPDAECFFGEGKAVSRQGGRDRGTSPGVMQLGVRF
jgi:hypothetical protein